MSAVLDPAFELRPLSADDLAAVMAIENAIYAFPWTPGNFRDSLAAGYHCTAYLRDGELIGYAVLMLASGEAHLLNLSIAAASQRRGCGSALLRHLCTSTRQQGARRMFLEARLSNAGGLRLYESQGFRRVGLRRDYYPASGGREDALVLSLFL